MSDSPDRIPAPATIEREAAAWVLRCDRGLTPVEQDDFSQWLAADPRHGRQLARHRRHWSRLDQLAEWCPQHSGHPNPDLLAPPPRRRFRRFLPLSLTLAAAAGVAVAFFAGGRNASPSAPHSTAAPAAPDGQQVLADGSIIELNRDAAVTICFTSGERRVRLERGEAHFAVAKDPARPFIVTVRGIDVRAIGTAFNVRMDAAVVEVLVTEGRVQVDAQPAAAAGPDPRHEQAVEPPLIPVLGARQRAVVSLSPRSEPPQIATLTVGEIERVLAWQHRLLDFTARPLAEVVAEFNRRNVVQLVVIDPELASVRISGAFRSDNIKGFVRLLEAGFGVRTERRGETDILLRQAR